MGPPSDRPRWFSKYWPKRIPAVSVPTSRSLCQYQKAEPSIWLVPDFVMALMSPPPKPLCRTSNGAVITWYSRSASSVMLLACTCPPGCPV